MALGRISGPLLKADLLRDGIDLAFETNLLYLDVNNLRVGIRTDSPTHDLHVNGTTRTTNLEVTDQLNIGDINFTANTITGTTGVLNLVGPEDTFILYQNKLRVDSIDIENNVISTNASNTDLELRPNGTGSVEIFADTNVYGNIHATGNITADGNIQLGDADTDSVSFNADITSDILPDVATGETISTWKLGSADKRWADIWVNTIYTDQIDTGDAIIDNININLRQGNIYYVAANGSDTYSGTHQNDPFATVKYALSQASSGETVYIYPGTYEEEFPLTIPAGVTVRGAGIRAVKIIPTTATRYNDAFLLNGETTVEDLTLSGFYSGGNYYEVTAASLGSTTFNVGLAPFAHTYVSGGTINISTVDYAITGATYDHTTGEVTVTHATGTATPGDDIFLSGLVFSCNGGERTFPDNGYGFRFATDFEVNSRSPYIKNVTVLTTGSVVDPVTDPLGFDAGDAGKGAYIDGAYATAGSREASMLFHSVTFICPGVNILTATNGARVEWLNSFTYYADKGFYAYASNDGIAGDGKTRLKLEDVVGTWAPGDTITYYDTDGVTVLATDTIESIEDDFYIIDGRSAGWEGLQDRVGKTVFVNGDAQLTTAEKKFGTASLALDGTGDYLSVASQPDFGFGTGDFTIEGWFYLTDLVGNQQLFDLRAGATGDVAPTVYVSNGGQIRYYTNSADRILGSTILSGQWYHVALTRSGTDTKLFVNGSQVGSTYTDSNDYGSAKPLTIGSRWDGGNEFGGYLDDFRIVKGVAKYTTTFTAPTSPFLGDNDTVLLLHFNGTNGSTVIVDDGVTYQDIRSSSGGTATYINVADYSDFGAEIRSIGSAAVYGNYGIYGDGPGVIGYFIGQNLAYIGNGKSSTNDPSTVIQANEVVEQNGAKIYYSSVDHKGDFRVGDLFYVNQQTGEVTFQNSNIDIGTSLTFTDGGGNVTFIDASKIETGNFRISNNTIESLTGEVNFLAANDQINFLNNVNITGNLDVTGNVTIGGNITIGDELTDSVSIIAGVDSDVIPNFDNTYNLGSVDKQWANLWAQEVNIGGIRINTNVISTVDSNADLELRASGTGRIYVPSNDVEIDQNLTVNGYTTLQNTTINGDITHVGNVDQTGDYTQVGNVTVTGNVTISDYTQFENIRIDGNVVSTTLSNSDLELQAAGTGRIYVPSNDVEIDQNLTVSGNIQVNDLNVTTTITANKFTTGNIEIDDNYITTTQSNSDLELYAAGTGRIYVPSNDVEIDQQLTVNSLTTLVDTDINGTVTHIGNLIQTGDVTQTGNYSITGDLTVDGLTAQFENIKLEGNVITTTQSSSDLELRANAAGRIYIPDNNVEIDQNLTVGGYIQVDSLNVTTTITANKFTTGDIEIDDNVITTTQSNSDLELKAAGTGRIYAPTNDVEIEQQLTVNSLTTLVDTDINGTVTHVGDLDQTGNVDQTGDYDITGNLTVSNIAQFENIKIDGNVIETTQSNSDLELIAEGEGRVYVPSNNVEIEQDLTVHGTTNTADLNMAGTITSETFSTGDIEIRDNYIKTTQSNSNLELSANGTGLVRVEELDIQENEILSNNNNDITLTPNGTGVVRINSTQSFKVPVGTTLERPAVAEAGMIRFNTSLSRYEGFDGTNWIRLDGITDLDENTRITAELTPGANDNTIRFYTDGALVADLNSTRLSVSKLFVDDIVIDANEITTSTTNTNISLQTTGTGAVIFENFAFRNNTITNIVNNAITTINQTGDGYFRISGTAGFVVPYGTNLERPPAPTLGMVRYDTDNVRLEVYDGTQWVSAAGSTGAITVTDAEEIAITTVLMLG